MVHIAPTQLDALRSVARLDANASAGINDVLPDNSGLTMEDTVNSVAGFISFTYGGHYGRGSWSASHHLGRISSRDVKTILIAWGASPFTVEQWSLTLARRVRADHLKGGA